MLRKCGNVFGCAGGRQNLSPDGQVNSLWVNQLPMHADRPSSDSMSMPLSEQLPHTLALINVVHLFEIRCDSPMSLQYSLAEQTVMRMGPRLVFYQQVLMLL